MYFIFKYHSFTPDQKVNQAEEQTCLYKHYLGRYVSGYGIIEHIQGQIYIGRLEVFLNLFNNGPMRQPPLLLLKSWIPEDIQLLASFSKPIVD